MGNDKEKEPVSPDQLLSIFESLYAVAGESSPRQQARDEVGAIYKEAGMKLAEAKGQEVKYELDASMVEMSEPEEILELLGNKFEAGELADAVARSTQEIFGRWVNSALASLDEDRLLRMREVVLELGKSLNINQ